MKILIAGGSGLIGSHLSSQLKAAGHEVKITSRSKTGEDYIRWDVKNKTINTESRFDGVINLTGAGIVDQKWTKAYKREIISSRVDSIETLDRHFQRENYQPEFYLNASAVGIYGEGGDEVFKEDDEAQAEDFLVHVCRLWEQGVDEMITRIPNTYKLRIGVVLTEDGGAYPKLSQGKQVGVVPHLGSGNQYVSWIHVDDLCGIIQFLLNNRPASGVYNACAPEPVTNKALAVAIADRKGLGVSPPVPEFMVKLLLGERSVTVLSSTRVSSQKIQDAGFEFVYPQIDQAIRELEG